MSYGRDHDASTRGAGAIAARDKANPRASAARARARARALVARERALSGLTYGPRGGVQHALGRVAITGPVLSSSGAASRYASTIEGGKSATNTGIVAGARPAATKVPKFGLPAKSPTPPRPPRTLPTTTRLTKLLEASPQRPSRADVTTKPTQQPLVPVPTSPTDAPAPSRPTKVQTTPTTSAGGGGGGGGGMTLKPPADLPALPDDVQVPDVPAVSSPSISGTHLAIAAAIGLGAFLVLRKKKGAP